MGHSVSVQVRESLLKAYERVGCALVRSSMVSRLDERQPFSFNLAPPILFLPIYDHQGMRHSQAGPLAAATALRSDPPLVSTSSTIMRPIPG